MDLLALVVLVVIAFVVFARKRSAPPESLPVGFNADYRHPNMAIDIKKNQIWLRDEKGHQGVLDRSDLLRWELNSTRRGTVKFDHEIQIHTRNLEHPVWNIRVSKKLKGIRSRETVDLETREAEEWMSRLTTWVNNS